MPFVHSSVLQSRDKLIMSGTIKNYRLWSIVEEHCEYVAYSRLYSSGLFGVHLASPCSQKPIFVHDSKLLGVWSMPTTLERHGIAPLRKFQKTFLPRCCIKIDTFRTALCMASESDNRLLDLKASKAKLLKGNLEQTDGIKSKIWRQHIACTTFARIWPKRQKLLHISNLGMKPWTLDGW